MTEHLCAVLGFQGGAGDCGGESAVPSLSKIQNLRCSSHKKYKCIAVAVALQKHLVPLSKLVGTQEDQVCKPFVQHHARPPVQFDAGAVNADIVTPPCQLANLSFRSPHHRTSLEM